MQHRRTGAVVSSFGPSADLEVLVDRVLQQCAVCVVVDNTPGEAPAVLSAIAGRAGVTVLRSGANVGLARALNRGLAELRRLGMVRAVLWDQDSRPAEDYLDVLSTVLDARVAEGRPAFAAGRQVERLPGHREAAGEAAEVASRRFLITSGLCGALSDFARVGPFREGFYVDLVDMDFSFRALAAGFELLHCSAAAFAHELGRPERARRVLFTRFRSSGHPPWRQYWVARNGAVLMREHAGRGTGTTTWLRRERLDWFGRALLAGPDRLPTAAALVRGVRDARSGRTDPRYFVFAEPPSTESVLARAA